MKTAALRFTLLALLCTLAGCSRESDRLVDPTTSATITDPVPTDPQALAVFESLKRTEPFTVKLDNGFTFDVAAARQSHLSIADIENGKKMALLATQAYNAQPLSSDVVESFKPFFVWVAERVELAQEEARIDANLDAERVEPLTSTVPFSIQTHCPPRYGMSVVNAAGYLTSHGYHKVPLYASGTYGRDYAKFISVSHWPTSSPGRWTYRNQGIATSDNHGIWFQDVEPNPELHAYDWWNYPGRWWGPFVAIWHAAC